ncbi:MAG: Trm112 family protein [Methanomicrobiales archaeon]|nr:Trm112 family protein [Methanomicrobiales archaeon]
MKRGLMEILCCPVCKGTLLLTVTGETGDEVLEGTLRCEACRVDYPITGGIPNLLPQTT